MFVPPHGLRVDTDGNVWVTDSQGNEAGTKGHQVITFSPEGEVLMRLGTAGQPGSGQGVNPPEGRTGRRLLLGRVSRPPMNIPFDNTYPRLPERYFAEQSCYAPLVLTENSMARRCLGVFVAMRLVGAMAGYGSQNPCQLSTH